MKLKLNQFTLRILPIYPAPEPPPPPPPPPPPENPPPVEVELLNTPEVTVIEWIVLERLVERIENCWGEIVPRIAPLAP